MTRTRRILSAAFLLLVGIPAVGVGYQAITGARDRSAYPPTRRAARGSTSVVAACTSIAPVAARPPSSWSDPAPAPRTSAHLAEELPALLAAANIAPPYVPVGHSFGGYTVPLFVQRYAAEVPAFVLVDPSDLAPVSSADRAEMENLGPQCTRNEWLARLGARRLFCLDDACALRHGHAAETTSAILAQGFTASFTRAKCEEGALFWESRAQLERAAVHVDAPLVLLIAGKNDDGSNGSTEEGWRTRNATVRDMCKLSKECTTRIAKGSNHRIPEEEPDAVVDAILAGVALARAAK